MDFQSEADRLLALDESGREREMVVIALRLGEAAKQTWAELRKLDEEFLHGLTSFRERNVGPFEGPE